MNVLITGGTGFVGLNIARELMSVGHQVVTFDLGGIKPAAYFEEASALRVHTGNVLSAEQITDAIRQYNIDCIVHGAAITASQDRETTAAIDIVSVNTLGTINVLEAALATGIKRVVSLGTGSVFGSAVKSSGTLDESKDIPQPDTLYGISKYAAERVAVRYRQTRALDVVVARLGVVFGRYEHDTGLRDTLSAPLALGQLALNSEHATVYRGLPNDWVYASDVARAVALLIDAQRVLSSVYQIGTGRAWSVENWCEQLAQTCPGFTYDMVDEQAQATIGRVTPLSRPCFSIDRLNRELGYEPKFMPQAAFDDYMQWLRTTV